ncbi:CDP-diacylglycerol--glycerol-3-phosphate 3-phosphatidyltransferase [Rhizopus azygosporus]|uniref:CDP-diacylglycerol--glycerol-3-phosphate 3-phosphatidyltransferase n=1 Tax=Rhizopus azygosporus TaxID=86630 RepID=A0A367J7N5_RHIAZ|nr:CDP-diacylglycerol--glycerol-3-phosphate 3-phosphatidyltransferase [Rhizopus azygosporus]
MFKRIFYTQCQVRHLTTSCIKRNIFKDIKTLQPLQQYAPTFYTHGQHVKPLYQPSAFYAELKSRILSAKERVFIAALYIGHSEKELVDTIRTALSQSSTLQVHILIDCLRGTRNSKGQSSATLLLPLIQDYPKQIKVSLYHTPDLTGILKKALPQRFNETIGLMHLKLYGFDNTIMLSGANLSTDYFVNRQDRYILFDQQPELTTYYHDLLKLVSSCSYHLVPAQNNNSKYRLELSDSMADPVKESQRYKSLVHSRLQQFLIEYQNRKVQQEDTMDTAILPVIQMGPFCIRQDEKVTLELLNIANQQQDKWTIHLTSGYFNFTDKYKAVILKTRAFFRFLTASPEANGFFNSKGVSKFLPPAYTHIEKQFYRHVKRAGRQDEISIEEYKRPGWTYHAKGLWVYFGNESRPSMTMIGSPNFGQRSSERDLEAQAVVITQNEQLKNALHKEIDLLHQHSELVSKETFDRQDRRVPYGVRIATAFVKTML